MKMKVIYNESTNIEVQTYDRVLINMSYEEFLDLRVTLLTAKEEACLNYYDKLVKARDKATITWK